MDRGMHDSVSTVPGRTRAADDEHQRSGGSVRTNETPSPRHVNDQDAPEPERLITPEEEAGMDLAELDDPPQAEGARLTEQEEEQQERWREQRS